MLVEQDEINVIIAGKNNIAVEITDYLLQNLSGYNVLAVLNQNDLGVDSFQRSFKKYCLENKVRIISLEDAYLVKNSVFLSLEFDRIVKPKRFKHDNIFNIHFSLLPQYKGMYTSAWPIINNEKKTGVTLHKIDAGIDTGNIIAQKEIAININETAKSLYFKYLDSGVQLVKDNLSSILIDKYESTKQDASRSSYYSKSSINYLNLVVDLNKTAIEIKKQINAFSFRDFQIVSILDRKVFGSQILKTKSKLRAGNVVAETDVTITIVTWFNRFTYPS